MFIYAIKPFEYTGKIYLLFIFIAFREFLISFIFFFFLIGTYKFTNSSLMPKDTYIQTRIYKTTFVKCIEKCKSLKCEFATFDFTERSCYFVSFPIYQHLESKYMYSTKNSVVSIYQRILKDFNKCSIEEWIVNSWK